MSESNRLTIDAYNSAVNEYIENTPQVVDGHVKKWIDENLAKLDTKAWILEIGSAFSRDADYIESKGYLVERTDASEGFVDYLVKKGHKAKLLNILTDELDREYDMVFADAVFLHFNPEELKRVIKKVHSSLKPSGKLVFSLKQGDGEELTDRKLGVTRYFCYWQPQAIEAILKEVGFASPAIDVFEDTRKDKPSWLMISAEKEENEN